MSVVKSLSEVRRTLPQMWLQKKSPNTQKVMMTEKPSLPNSWRVTSMNSFKKEVKGKKKSTFGEDSFLVSRTTRTSQTKEGRSSFRERLGAWGKELLKPEWCNLRFFTKSGVMGSHKEVGHWWKVEKFLTYWIRSTESLVFDRPFCLEPQHHGFRSHCRNARFHNLVS